MLDAFSYTWRLRLVLFFGFLPCVFLLIYSIPLFVKPIESLNKQMEGLDYISELNATVEALLSSKTLDLSQNFARLTAMQKKMESKKETPQNLEFLNISSKYNIIYDIWKEHSKLENNSALALLLLKSYASLLDSLAITSDLMFNPDYGTHYYIYAYLKNLPELQLVSLVENIHEASRQNGIYREPGQKLESLEAGFALANTMNQQLRFALNSQKSTLQRYLYTTLALIALGSFLAAVLCLAPSILRPLQSVKKASENLSKGHFSVSLPVHGNDEVSEINSAFNQMVRFLEKIFSEVAHIAKGLSGSSWDIISSAKQLETNTNLQEKAIKEIASCTKGIMQAVQQFGEDIQKVSQGASLTNLLASTGSTSLSAMEEIMQQMIKGSSNIVHTLSSLQEKMATIHRVIETTIKIADQSNLLSLNTAIRASKSGGHGRGFVVIADKIREMANQIAYATLDIEKVIKEIVSIVAETAKEVDEFSETIHNQVKDTSEINDNLNKLISNTQYQIGYFKEINERMLTQNKEILDIHKALEKLRGVAQDTTKSVHRLYAEIEYLHDSSQNLQELVPITKETKETSTTKGFLGIVKK